MSRCTGHCCRNFPLSATLQEVKDDLAKGTRRFDPEEAGKLVDMLIPLGEVEGKERFTCRHFNTETGDCGNYEHRPKMCWDYPYGDSCKKDGCTFVPEAVVDETVTKLRVIA